MAADAHAPGRLPHLARGDGRPDPATPRRRGRRPRGGRGPDPRRVGRPGRRPGAEAHLTKKRTDADGQLWKLKPVPNLKDAIKFVSKPSDRVLAITSGSKDAGVRIILWDEGEGTGNQFGFFPPSK